MRAARLGLAQAPVALGTETNLATIVATLDSAAPPVKPLSVTSILRVPDAPVELLLAFA